MLIKGMSTFKEPNKDASNVDATFREERVHWFIKYNRLISFVFAISIFLILLSFAIYNGTTQISRQSSKKNFRSLRSFCKEETVGKVVCENSNMDTSEDNEIIKFINNYDKRSISLLLSNVNFPNNIVTKEVFSKIVASISTLEVKSCAVTDIEDKTFSQHPFTKLTELILADTNIEYLRKNSFLEMSSLKSFQVRYFSFKVVNVESGVLNGMANTLQILQMSYCLWPETLQNLTGLQGTFLPSLILVDFRANPQLTEIKPHSFKNARNIQSLYLSENSLSVIHNEAFQAATAISLLTLNSNSLSKLAKNVLPRMVNTITLHNNLWHCDCELQWLKKFYQERITNTTVAPQCENFDLKTFDEVEFCSHTTQTQQTKQTSTELITVPSMETTTNRYTTEETGNLIVKCRDYTKSPIIVTESFHSELIETVEVSIPKEIVKLRFQETDLDPFHLQVIMTGSAENYSLYWFETNDKNVYNCTARLQNQMFLEHLKRGTTYTICLLHETNLIYSPHDCNGITIPLEPGLRTWIPNNLRNTIIASLAAIIIILIVLTSLLVFYCILKHPSLIKGNKKVIIIKQKKANEIYALPREYEKPTYVAPSVTTFNNGYMTPKYTKYQRVKYRSPLQRSYSDESIFSDTLSYVCAKTPTRLQLETWRTNANARRRPRLDAIYKNDYCSEYDEIPPPLPPGGPPKKVFPKESCVINHDNPYSTA